MAQVDAAAQMDASALMSILDAVSASSADASSSKNQAGNATAGKTSGNDLGKPSNSDPRGRQGGGNDGQTQAGRGLQTPQLAGDGGSGFNAQMLALMSRFTEGQGLGQS